MATAGVRITETAFEAMSGIFFGIALIAAVGRSTISWREKRTVQLDDVLLIFSCVFLISATVVLYKAVQSVYALASLSEIPPNVIDLINTFQKDEIVYLILTWFTIFLVKYSFLFFFRRMIDRLGKMIRYWKVVMVFTTIVFCWSIASPFASCSKFGLAAASCTAGPAGQEHVLALASITIALDIISDFMIVVIPVWVLWKVKLRTSQKLGLGLFLCLNVCLAIIAIVRVSGIRYQGNYDQIWGFFWQQMEACIAVLLFSFTGFRSIFVSRRSSEASPNCRREKDSPMKAGRPRSPWLKKGGLFPSIPSATLTGIRTFIRGEGHTMTLDTQEGDELKKADRTVRGRDYENSTNEEELRSYASLPVLVENAV